MAATCSASRRARSTLPGRPGGAVVVGPAAPAQLGEQGGVAAHVLQAGGQLVDAVEVAAEADVLDAGDLADVLDVVGDLRQRGPRAAGARRATPASAATAASVVGAAAPATSAGSAASEPVGDRLGDEAPART